MAPKAAQRQAGLPAKGELTKAMQGSNEDEMLQMFSKILECVAAEKSKAEPNDPDSMTDGNDGGETPVTKKSIELLVDVFNPDDRKVDRIVVADCFVDVLWLQTSLLEQPAACRPLVHVVKSVLNACRPKGEDGERKLPEESASLLVGHLTTRLLETCDASFLEAISVIPAAADLQKKLRLTNTTVNYRQHKFNILAEEAEGYSKLLHFLLIQGDSDVASTESSVKRQMGSLISTYSLDPNRCLDVSIDVLEHDLLLQRQSERDAMIEKHRFLLWCINACAVTQKLPQLLGFKLKGRLEQQSPLVVPNGFTKKSKERTVESLLYCIAWLCLQQVLTVTDMLQYLPDNENDSYCELLESTYQKVVKLEKERIRNVGRVRLTSGDDDKKAGDSDENKNSELLKPLKNHSAILLIHVFLSEFEDGWKQIRDVAIFQQQWSALAFLFPETVGVAICDSVQHKVTIWLEQCVPVEIEKEKGSENKENAHGSRDLRLDDVLGVLFETLIYTWESGCIMLRPILYCQICRLLTILLRKEKDIDQQESFELLKDFLQQFLLPSLSLFLSNPSVSMEIWNVLELLPYRCRYSLYESWRGHGLERMALKTDKPLWLVEGELMIGKDARYALKRLSKDTIRDMSRAVAKCCHSHPLVVFTTILNQIESYDNLVQVMVDSCRFVTPLSLDVLAFCILQRLIGSVGGANRSRLKENGVNVSQWLQSLEAFTGAFFKRFPFVEFQGILCYLIQRVKDGHVMELGVLRTLLKSSGGWGFADYAPAASLSTTQLEGRAGSTLLTRETMFFGIVEDINIRASQEVRRVLQSDNIGVSLLILLAQVRHKIVFESSSSSRAKPVKLIGNLFDSCQVVMAILLDFLTNEGEDSATESEKTLTLRRYADSLPSLSELHNVYKLDVASAWMLCRPLVRAALQSSASSDSKVTENSVPDLFDTFKISDEFRQEYRNMLSATTWEHFSTELFEVFYTTTLYDLSCPEDLYNAELMRLEKRIEEVDRLSHHKAAAQPVSIQPGAAPEKSDKEEIERMRKVSSGLESDLAKQKEHVISVRRNIEGKARTLFPREGSLQDSAMAFLHRCVYPRCMQGPDDALFCARFVKLLHDTETPGFGTLHFLDSLITVLSRALFCLTEGEAACASILLSETWKVVSRWRYDDEAFNEELLGKPGSFMDNPNTNEEKGAALVSKEDYRHLYNKWHAAIGAACVGCLHSSEYMHLRNCLVVLTRMVENYPTRPGLANKLLRALKPLQDESNSLADIRASAQAYGMQLKKARDDGVWKEEDAATVKAREEKEKEAAKQRHRKAEEQMEAIKRDQQKITEEIGDSRDRDRDRGRGRPASMGTGKPFEAPLRGRDERREEDRRTEERRRGEERRGGQPPPANDRWARDRGPPSSSYASIGSSAGGRRDEGPPSRGLEGRWQRANDRDPPPPVARGGGGNGPGAIGAGRGSKRSRPSSPMEQGEAREELPPKRVRTLQDGQESEETSRGRRPGGRRRHGGRR